MSKAPFASKPAGKATLSVGGKNIELPVSRVPQGLRHQFGAHFLTQKILCYV